MATVIFRPTADKVVNHSCSAGSSGYTLINETTADDDSSYLYQDVSSTSNATKYSSFGVTGIIDSTKFKIISSTVYIRARCTKGNNADTAELSYEYWFGGTQLTGATNSLTTSYSTFSKTYNAADLGISDKTFTGPAWGSNYYHTIAITTGGQKNASKNDNFQNRITQVYVELTYEPVSETTGTGIYIKSGGAFAEAQAAYKKVNGVWVQQTDIATLKTEMQSGKYKVST